MMTVSEHLLVRNLRTNSAFR